MKQPPASSHFLACLLAPIRRPVSTIAVAAVVVLLATISLCRTTVSGSLYAMLGESSPAAAALGRIVRSFRASDDLLVVASVPNGDPANKAAAARLVAFAGRLKAAIEGSATAAPMVARIGWEKDPELRRFVQNVVLPAGLYYVDDQDFAGILRRLSPDEVRQQLRLDEALLAAPGPAASAMAKAVQYDPLRLREFVSGRFSGAADFTSPSRDTEPELSGDGRSLLIRVGGVRGTDDLEFASRFTDDLSRLVSGANTDGLDVRLSGGYAIASFTARRIRGDMISSTLSSIVMLLAVIAAVYLSVLAPLLICTVTGLGIVAGFGLHAVFAPAITPLSAVLGAMLGGLGVDYGIHFLSHYHASRADGLHSRAALLRALAQLGSPLFTACLTTVFGFVALIGAHVAMLRDFAIVGSIGLASVFVAVLTLMPASLVLLERRGNRSTGRPTLGWVTGLVARHPRFSIALSLAMALISAFALASTPGHLPPVEGDRTTLHPQPNPPLDASEFIAEQFSLGESLLVEVTATSPEELLARCHDADKALRNCTAAPVSGILGLSTLLPDPRTVAERRTVIAALNADATVADFESALRESEFAPDAFSGYAGFLRTLLSAAHVPGISDVLSSAHLTELLFPTDAARGSRPPDRTVLVVRLTRHLRERDDRETVLLGLRSALSGLPGTILTGPSVISYDLERATHLDFPRFAAIAFGLILVWLCIAFRRVRDVGLAMICVAFPSLCLLGVMVLTRQRFNTVNIIALPLLAGVAVDNGVFLVSTFRRARRATDMLAAFRALTQAIFASGATTIVAFGTMYWTSTPAIRSFGLAVMIGVSASIWGAIGLLMPLLILMKAREEPALQPLAAGSTP